MWVGDQLHAPADLLPGKTFLTSVGDEEGLVPELISKWWKKENSFLCWQSKSGHPARNFTHGANPALYMSDKREKHFALCWMLHRFIIVYFIMLGGCINSWSHLVTSDILRDTHEWIRERNMRQRAEMVPFKAYPGILLRNRGIPWKISVSLAVRFRDSIRGLSNCGADSLHMCYYA